MTQTSSLLAYGNGTSFDYDSIDEAFPNIDPGLKPLGTNVLVQIRHPKKKTAGGIILMDDSRSTEYYNTQVGKVLALGNMAFKTIARTTKASGEEVETVVEWPEGCWFKEGDFVRMPKYGGDRFTVPYTDQSGDSDEYVFAIFKAKDILGIITGDPLTIKAYLE